MRSTARLCLEAHLSALILAGCTLAGCQCLQGSGLDVGDDAKPVTLGCADYGAECGALTLPSGETLACGGCREGLACDGANQCGCSAPSDADMCLAHGFECGLLSAPDTCGKLRNIQCGTCFGEVCGGDPAYPHTCACLPEDDQELCLRVGAECGAVTAIDGCGNERHVQDCGQCWSGDLCGPNNRCAPYPCHEAWCVLISPFSGTLNAIAASSATDVWAVGQGGAVVHTAGSGWARISPNPTAETLLAVAETATSVWVAGERGAVLHSSDGIQWTSVSVPGTTRWTAVGLAAADDGDVWMTAIDSAAGTHAVLHGTRDGWRVIEETTTATAGAPASTVWIDREAGRVWAVLDGAVLWWTRAEWTAATPGDRIASWGHDAGAGAGVQWLSGTSSSDVWVWSGTALRHFDGSAWASVSVRGGIGLNAGCGSVFGEFWAVGADANASNAGVSVRATTAATVFSAQVAVPLRGCTSADDTLWAVGERGALLEFHP